jgi:hypothetical protein
LQASQRTVETAADAQNLLDLRNDPIPLSGKHPVREAQRPVAGLGEPGVPPAILLWIMERTIELDDQPGGMTAEIGDEAADWELTPEVEIVGPPQSPQPDPEPTLPTRWFIAQAPSELAVDRAAGLASANFVIRVAERAPHP